MDPHYIPFNALIVGPTNPGKSHFVVKQLYGPFRHQFENIAFICPTFAFNKTYFELGLYDPRMFFINCSHQEVEVWLRIVSLFFAGTRSLIVLDDCAASKDVKGRTGELVDLAFSARHMGISVWVIAQKITSITASFRENVAAVVLFYTPSSRTTKAIFEDYAGELSHDDYKTLLTQLKEKKYSFLVFSQRFPFLIYSS